MENTLVGVYDSYSRAQDACNELVAAGFDRSDLQLSPSEESATARQASLTSTTRVEPEDQSFGAGIRNFFRDLFGGEDEYREHADTYSEAVRRGHYLLTVHAASEAQSDKAMEVMNRFSPIDIEERAEQWRSRGWTKYDEAAPALSDAEIEEERRTYTTGAPLAGAAATQMADTTEASRQASGKEATIPVIQEELQVGKRQVDRGGVRVYQRVTETPVDETVRLREETVNVERRPVDQPASEADLAGMQEGTIEVRETAEEPVIAKTARVVEEVVIGKESRERTEQIQDTVRRTDVEVEQLGASGATSGTLVGDEAYREHFQTTYGTSGGKFEDYASAYRYGSTAAADERFRGHDWSESEEEVHADWDSRYGATTPWEKAKNAVRYGWEKATR